VVCTNWFAKQYKESDLSPVIVYRSHNGSIWTRPKAVFFEMVEVDGVLVPRFAAIDDDEVQAGQRRLLSASGSCSAHCLIAPHSAE
jgi:hypothetical protein